MTEPRMALLRDGEFDEAQTAISRSYVWNGSVINVVRLFARHMDFFAAFKPFARYAQFRSPLPARIRELAILRLLVLNRGDYEWGHHCRIGREAGLSWDEIARIKIGSDAGWNAQDQAILRTVDSLRRDADLDDDLYAEVRAFLSERELFDLVVTVGNYNLVSTLLKVARTPCDAGAASLADPLPSGP